MNIIKAYENTLYLRQRSDGSYETVNPATQQTGMKLFSIEKATQDDRGNLTDKYFYIPKTIWTYDVEAYAANVYSQADVAGIETGQSNLFIDGTLITFTFVTTAVLADIVSGINLTIVDELGSDYSAFATNETTIKYTSADSFAVGEVIDNLADGGNATGTILSLYTVGADKFMIVNVTSGSFSIVNPGDDFQNAGATKNGVAVEISGRIRFTCPNPENSIIVVFPDTLFTSNLFFLAGEYPGDIPFPDRSYEEVTQYYLYQESTTPNNGTASDKFYPSDIVQNNVLKYVSQFDQDLITKNPRAKLLFDSFAYVVSRLDEEMTRFIDQLDLNKIDTNNIEYVAYLFGVDLGQLVRTDGTISARETLKNIMRAIQSKGTEASFQLLLRYAGLSSYITEYYIDDNEVQVDIDTTNKLSFFERFVLRDSDFRNPVLNYGSSVNNFAELPIAGYAGEIIRVLLDQPGIYQWSETSESWELLFSSVDRIYGKGTNPPEFINDLDFRFYSINRQYEDISAAVYNESRLISGFEVLPRYGMWVGKGLWDTLYVDQPYRAEIISSMSTPFNLSNFTDRTLHLRVNGTEIEIDFQTFSNQITDFSAVTFDEVKNIIEVNYPELVCVKDALDKLVIRTTRVGVGTSIKTLTANTAFGFTLASKQTIMRTITELDITAGTANPSIDETAIPQVTTALKSIAIKQQDLSNPTDGEYDLYIHKDGSVIVVSDKHHFEAVYIPALGWATKDFSVNDATVFATVEVVNGSIAYITQEIIQDQYSPDLVLTQDQERAVVAFLRSKTNVANRTGAIGDVYEGVLPTPFPFYLRTGERNPAQTDEPGEKNEVVLNVSPIKSDFLLTLEVAKQTLEFVNFVRPVHIKALGLIFGVPEIEDVWPRASDRTADGDYMPGFWDGTQSVVQHIERFVGSVAGPETFNMTTFPLKSNIGGTATTAYVTVTKNGTTLAVADYSIDAGLGTVTVNVVAIGDVITVQYYTTDGKFSHENDIQEFLDFQFSMADGIFTSGDGEYYVTPTSGENEATQFANNRRQLRNNRHHKTTTLDAFSNGYGTAYYDTDWNNPASVNYHIPELTISTYNYSTENHVIIRLDSGTTNNIAIGNTITLRKTLTGSTFPTSAAKTRVLTFAAAGPYPSITVGATPADTCVNIISEINSIHLDNPHISARALDTYTVEIIDLSGEGLSVTSSISSGKPWAVYSEYYTQKKQMVNDSITGVAINVDSDTVSFEGLTEDLGGNLVPIDLQYYVHSDSLMRGHSNMDLTFAQLATETYVDTSVLRGITNPAIAGLADWPDSWAENTLPTDANTYSKHFHGSENFTNGAETGFVDMTDLYAGAETDTQYLRTTGGSDTDSLTARVQFSSPPLTTVRYFISGGKDVVAGDSVSTIITTEYNGGVPLHDEVDLILCN